MNDTTRIPAPSNTGSTLLGFALGAALGAGLALLLAPESGKRTRDRLGSTMRRWNKNAGQALEHARDAVTDLGDDAKSALRAGQESFQQDRTNRVARSERRDHLAPDAQGPKRPIEDAVR